MWTQRWEPDAKQPHGQPNFIYLIIDNNFKSDFLSTTDGCIGRAHDLTPRVVDLIPGCGRWLLLPISTIGQPGWLVIDYKRETVPIACVTQSPSYETRFKNSSQVACIHWLWRWCWTFHQDCSRFSRICQKWFRTFTIELCYTGTKILQLSATLSNLKQLFGLLPLQFLLTSL